MGPLGSRLLTQSGLVALRNKIRALSSRMAGSEELQLLQLPWPSESNLNGLPVASEMVLSRSIRVTSSPVAYTDWPLNASPALNTPSAHRPTSSLAITGMRTEPNAMAMRSSFIAAGTCKRSSRYKAVWKKVVFSVGNRAVTLLWGRGRVPSMLLQTMCSTPACWHRATRSLICCCCSGVAVSLSASLVTMKTPCAPWRARWWLADFAMSNCITSAPTRFSACALGSLMSGVSARALNVPSCRMARTRLPVWEPVASTTAMTFFGATMFVDHLVR
mmetsp:Transcript_73571/g.148842  ORF Transcript_73571/g.148842 Transcript_73571/m.148842 type:complete len:275 (-) Transcript_73571:52-876(-)